MARDKGPTPEQIVARASAVNAKYEEAGAEYRRVGEERKAVMKEMQDLGFSRVEIGRAFGMSPQAAGYAMGDLKRTPAKKPTTKKAPPAKS